MVKTIMTKSEFITKLGAELGVPEGQIGEQTPLASIPAWDSMGKLAVLAMIDTELKVDLPAGAVDHCQKVSHLVDLVRERLAG